MAVILHGILIGSFFAFLLAILAVTFREVSLPIERLIRSFALAAGALVALGAQTGGMSYADFLIKSLSSSRPAGAFAAVGAVLVPAGAGACIRWYVLHAYKRSEVVTVRAMAFVGMLAMTSFLETYAVATRTKGLFLGAAALPNAAFVVGVVLYVVFAFPGDSPEGEHPTTAFMRGLRRTGKREV